MESKPTQKSVKTKIKARWQIYLLLLLPTLHIFIFQYIPMGGIILAFKKYNMRLGILNSPWVGFDNFMRFFQSYNFGVIMKNTISITVYSLFVGFPIPIIFALLLNSLPGRKFKKFVQTATYLPHFISTVVMVGLIFQLLNYRTGIYGTMSMLLTGNQGKDLFADAGLFKHIYVWSGIWQGTGFSAIMYIAALSNVDQSMHEAAIIDGATRFQRVRYIDWPSILPTVTIMLILACGRIMNVGFEKVYLMQNPMNISCSEVISTYVYKVGLGKGIGDFGFSTAIGLFNSVINFGLLVTVNKICNKINGSGIF